MNIGRNKKLYETILRLRKHGFYYREIAEMLNEDGHKTERGSAWSINSVRRALIAYINWFTARFGFPDIEFSIKIPAEVAGVMNRKSGPAKFTSSGGGKRRG